MNRMYYRRKHRFARDYHLRAQRRDMWQKVADLKPVSWVLLLSVLLLIIGPLILVLQNKNAKALGSLTFVCASSASGASTASCTGEQAGDLLVVSAMGLNGVIPTTAGGFTSINTASNSGGSSTTRTGINVGWTLASSSTSGSGTWTNGGWMIMHVYRGQSSSPIGNSSTEGGNNAATTVSYNADNLAVTNGTSWFVAFAARIGGDSLISTAPTGMTNRSTAGTFGAGFDTNAGTASNWPLTTVSGFSASNKYTSVVVEIEANRSPNAPTLSSPTNGSTVTSTTPNLVMSATDPDGDTVKYEVFVYNTTAQSGGNCSGSSFESHDQNVSQGGWSQAGAYASGSNATYTVQTAMTRGNSYCWQAQAKDPSGSNTFGSLSTPSTFTINSPPNTPTLSTPTSGATGVSTTPAFTLSTTDPDISLSQTGSGLSITSTSGPTMAALSSTMVAFIDSGNKQLRTYTWNGSTWSQTGSGLGITGTYTSVALAALSSTQVAYIDSSNQQLRTYTWNGSTWSQTGSGLGITGANFPGIAALSSSRVAFSDGSTSTLDAYDWNGSTWSHTGSTLTITGLGVARLAGLTSSRVAVVDGSNKMLVAYDFNGSTWSQTGSGLTVTTSGSIAMTDLSSSRVVTSLYSGTQQLLQAYDFNGSTWSQTGTSLSTNASTIGPALAGLSFGQIAYIDDGNKQLTTYNINSDYLQFRIYLYQSDCSTLVTGLTNPITQAGSQTGWSGQDANSGLAYNSGTTATYTYQSTLSASTTYCWKADAVDPAGSTVYGSASSTQLFTTAAAGPTTDQILRGGEYFSGGIKHPFFWAN